MIDPHAKNEDAFFSSPRERRLWIWTVAVVVAIYATLGLAATLVGYLRDTGLIEISFVVGLILVLATIVTEGLKARPGGVEIAVGLGVTAVYLLVIVRMAIPAVERTHLIEYSVVALLIYEALTERAGNGRRVPVPPLLAILATTLLGTVDELIQYVLPNRVFDPIDILFNFIAAVMAVAGIMVLAWVRRWRTKSRANEEP